MSQSGAVSATLGGSATSSCSTVEENTNYGGADIGNALSGSAEGCCAICKGRTGCNAYTWTNYNSGTCWLKSSKGTATAQTGARSAQISSSSSTCTLVNNVDYANNDIGSAPARRPRAAALLPGEDRMQGLHVDELQRRHVLAQVCSGRDFYECWCRVGIHLSYLTQQVLTVHTKYNANKDLIHVYQSSLDMYSILLHVST